MDYQSIDDQAALFGVLAEPTTGIDVASARQVRQIIAELHRAGTTVFLTTHYIDEAERLCERIAFIVRGHIVRMESTEALRQPIQGKHVLLLSVSDSGDDVYGEIALAFPHYKVQSSAPGQVRVESGEPVNLSPLVRFLEERKVQVTEARRYLPSLEDVFVQVTGIEAGLMRREKKKAGR